MNLTARSHFILAMAIALTLGCASVPPARDDSSQPGSGGHAAGGASFGGQAAGGQGTGEGGTGQDGEAASCQFGENATKCDSSANQTCEPSLSDMEISCATDDDCGSDALCLENMASEPSCYAVSGICVAHCSSDAACPLAGDARSRTHCNPRSGLCEAEPAEGLEFGETCTPEQDECRGTCAAAGATYECEEYCRIGAASGCGESKLEGSGVACAFFAYDLSAIGAEQGAGDTGVCAKLCDCNADCPGAQRCLQFPTAESAGICAAGITEADSLACDAGAGGAGMGGAKGAQP